MRCLILLTALLLPIAVFADATLVYHDGGGRVAIRTLVKNHQVRMDEGSKSSVIYDVAANTMTVIQHKEKRYFVFDQQTVNQLGSQVSAAQAELKAQLEQMPPAQRAMMEKMMGGLKQSLETNLAQTEVNETGKTDTVNDIACREMTYQIGGADRYDLCLADPSDLGVSQTDYLATRKAYAFASEFVKKIASNVGLETTIDYSRIEGMSVRVIRNGGDPMLLHEVLDTVPADAFVVPAGYKKESIAFE